MFNPSTTVINSFVERVVDRYKTAFPKATNGHYEEVLNRTARMALESLVQCDCPYHDINHTVLVTDAGQTILYGRLISKGDVSPHEWVHAVIAMLFHDIGFLRGLLRGDDAGELVINEAGDAIDLADTQTDSSMNPHHVTRGRLYIQERFIGDPEIDVSTICNYIEMTRFPVPEDSRYQNTGDFAGLVRAADLIGQLADPLYIKKLPRLFAEFQETGEHKRLGYREPDDIRRAYPKFFATQVEPYIGDALHYLGKTQEGNQWIANLYRHVYLAEQSQVELIAAGTGAITGNATAKRTNTTVAELTSRK